MAESSDGAKLVAELRASFATHKTQSIEWRLEQLGAIEQMVVDNEPAIRQALSDDLGKPGFEAYRP